MKNSYFYWQHFASVQKLWANLRLNYFESHSHFQFWSCLDLRMTPRMTQTRMNRTKYPVLFLNPTEHLAVMHDQKNNLRSSSHKTINRANYQHDPN